MWKVFNSNVIEATVIYLLIFSNPPLNRSLEHLIQESMSNSHLLKMYQILIFALSQSFIKPGNIPILSRELHHVIFGRHHQSDLVRRVI